jgi:hypothetical protein
MTRRLLAASCSPNGDKLPHDGRIATEAMPVKGRVQDGKAQRMDRMTRANPLFAEESSIGWVVVNWVHVDTPVATVVEHSGPEGH